MKSLLKKYGQAWTLLYFFIYLPWFLWLEQRTTEVTIISSRIDAYIPFCEYFAIPYFLWFIYVPLVTLFVLFIGTKEDFYKHSAMLFIGMTVCLVIYTLWPNAQLLRVAIDTDKNIFTQAIAHLYQTDTSTNVCPSIHVYNSLVCHTALLKNAIIRDKKHIRFLSLILMIAICISTLFLNQHSIVDVVASLALFLIMYTFVYSKILIKTYKFLKNSVSEYSDSSSGSSR
ncbi:phosphatase PAP2 family protein [Parasporobacterium paucivorans]|uniref:PAP2 superfamily n=1 Tax=Parasporobacterium paucivorans DSM 15970 TaxID=1122934 RepID=A0A1M6FPH8_9FIRM|nr:phosphatase PAP2 family protein [Parasporobacterium paucivorans]SHI99668.1 PAP2 superfamily [Parasporobacterium paucivorans DSM 15970]